MAMSAPEDAVSTSQLSTLIKEWLTTEDELRALSAAIREKRKRAKTVKDLIVKIMKGGGIGKLNISAGAVTTRTKVSKAPLSKKFLTSALTDFFNGDATMAAKCAAFIEEHRPVKSTDNLSLDAP
jgi:hypothetical protein